MTIANTIDYRGVRGDSKYMRGTYTVTDGATGGDVDTGLTYCKSFHLSPTGATKSATTETVNETVILAGAAITIVTPANGVGIWEATGY